MCRPRAASRATAVRARERGRPPGRARSADRRCGIADRDRIGRCPEQQRASFADQEQRARDHDGGAGPARRGQGAREIRCGLDRGRRPLADRSPRAARGRALGPAGSASRSRRARPGRARPSIARDVLVRGDADDHDRMLAPRPQCRRQRRGAVRVVRAVEDHPRRALDHLEPPRPRDARRAPRARASAATHDRRARRELVDRGERGGRVARAGARPASPTGGTAAIAAASITATLAADRARRVDQQRRPPRARRTRRSPRAGRA